MLHALVKSFLDYYTTSNKDIIFKCNDEVIEKKTRFQLITDHSPLLEREIKGFDIDEKSFCLVLDLKPEQK